MKGNRLFFVTARTPAFLVDTPRQLACTIAFSPPLDHNVYPIYLDFGLNLPPIKQINVISLKKLKVSTNLTKVRTSGVSGSY